MTSSIFADIATALAAAEMPLDPAQHTEITEALVNSELINTALSFYGLKEVPGPASSPTISKWLAKWLDKAKVKASKNDDQTAWCSVFVNEIADMCGCMCSNKINARSWLDVGTEVPLEQAKPGDVIILWRVSPKSWEGHVGFFIRKGPGVCWILGGNQSNAVNILSFKDAQVLGIRRLSKIKS